MIASLSAAVEPHEIVPAVAADVDVVFTVSSVEPSNVQFGYTILRFRPIVLHKNILGNDAPKTLSDFQKIKYNDADGWEYLKGLRRYIGKYPTSDKRYYDALLKIKEAKLMRGSVILPPVQKQAFILPSGKRDSWHITNRMLERNMTDDDIRGYMSNARAMFVQWGGKRQAFVSNDGIAVIHKTAGGWVYRTAWPKADFDEEIDAVMRILDDVGL